LRSAWQQGTALGVWLLLVLAHYLWTVEPGQPFAPFQHYHLLTDAFLAGRSSLSLQPPPELLALQDPYDPARNSRLVTCYDCSLFEGKYYLYFGVAPVFTLFLPFRLLLGFHLPEKHAALVYFWGALAVQSVLLLWLARRFLPAASSSCRGLLLLLLAFSGFQPFLLRRAVVYEVPPAAGVFFVSAAVACLLVASGSSRPAPWWLLTASLCLGLAVASRPHHVLAAPLLLWPLVARRREPDWRRDAALLVVPLALCCLAIAAYNQHRYGRFWEFGQSYVLDAYNHTRMQLFALRFLPSHLQLSLLIPPSVDLDFPFFHMYPAWLPELPTPRTLESVAGALACVPALALAFLAPLLARRGGADERRMGAWALALLLAAALVACFVASFRVVSVRYLPDFCVYLTLAAAIVGLRLDHELAQARSRWRHAFRALLALLVVYGTAVNLAVGLTGYYDQYRKTRPVEYARLEDAFLPLQRALLRATGGHGPLRIELVLPERPTPQAETLVRLASRDGGEDALCVRVLENGRVVFRYHNGARPPLRSMPVALARGATHVLQLSTIALYPQLRERMLTRLFPSARPGRNSEQVRLLVGGREVIVGQFDLEPGSARLAAGPAAVCPLPFSGRVLRADQEYP
jgi:hypothetical protein